jgi:hypothetical protein
MSLTTQRVTANEHEWKMYEPDHSLSWSLEVGSAGFKIMKCSDGSLDICADETGKRTKQVFINLKPVTVQSLREFLNQGGAP